MATGTGSSTGNRRRDEQDHQQERPVVRSPTFVSQPYLSGYLCELVEPSDPMQVDCPICLDTLCNPERVTCCGCRYCQSCINKYMYRGYTRCPTCNAEPFSTVCDREWLYQYYSLKVYCCLRSQGCDWIGKMEKLEEHLNLQPLPAKLLVGCQFCEVRCTYCVQPIVRRNFQAHVSDCPKRPYVCPHCNQYEATYEHVVRSHWPVCPFLPLPCPNNCNLVLQRQEMKHHIHQVCPLTLVQCDFHMVGCQVQVARRDMPSHINDDLARHMSLLQLHVMAHPEEHIATYLWIMMASIQRLVMENANIHSELCKAKKELREAHDNLEKAKTQLERTRETFAADAKKLQPSQERTTPLEVSGTLLHTYVGRILLWNYCSIYTGLH